MVLNIALLALWIGTFQMVIHFPKPSNDAHCQGQASKTCAIFYDFWLSWVPFSDAHCRGQASKTGSIFDDFWLSWVSSSDAHCRGQASKTGPIFDDFLAVLAVSF